MSNKRHTTGKWVGQEAGFSLIEMAIVLIIIGIIIGAVVKGKDIIRSGEQKKVYTKFLNEWRTAYLNFYDRSGHILGDTYHAANTSAARDGQADTGAAGSATPTAAGQDDLSTGGTDGGTFTYLGLSSVGLTAPVTNLDNNWQYRYVDSQGNSHTLDIAFAHSNPGGPGYNYMRINAIPNELAMAVDNMIDGSADCTAGEFILTGTTAWGTNPITAVNDVRWVMEF